MKRWIWLTADIDGPALGIYIDRYGLHIAVWRVELYIDPTGRNGGL